MNRGPHPVVILFVVFLSAPLGAQDINAHLDRFHAFVSPLIGGEWSYHTRMTGPDGKVVFEGTDFRSFEHGMRGRFVIENVYHETEEGVREHAAVQLMGVDLESGRLHLAQYWPWQATRLGDVVAEIRPGDDENSSELRGEARAVGTDYPVIRFECRFTSAERYQCESRTYPEEGQPYSSNTETYTRIRR